MYRSDLTQLLYSYRIHLQMMKSCLRDHRRYVKNRNELYYLAKSRQYAQEHLDKAKEYLAAFLDRASNIGTVEMRINGIWVS